MNYLIKYSVFENSNIDIIYSYFLEIADEYNITKVDNIYKSNIQDSVYKIYSINNIIHISIFFDDALSGNLGDGRNLSKEFIRDIENFKKQLKSNGFSVEIEYRTGSLLYSILIIESVNNI